MSAVTAQRSRRGRAPFAQRVEARAAVIAVIGLGYVGLPLAVAHTKRGFRVIGIDVDDAKVGAISAGRSYIRDVSSADVADAVRTDRFSAFTSYAPLRNADVIFVCVPTPCTRNKEPDTSRIAEAARGIARHLRRGQLIILRSTSYPGTTEELMKPILEENGLKVGRDIFLAFAPERVDPGRTDHTIHTTPVVLGGCDPESTRRAALVLGKVADRVVTVSSPAAAEMAKLLENVFRNVNIALVNQLAMLCDRMGLNVWEIVDAAATKPYGFQPFHPGPGVGGHCIPVDPYYLAWKAREFDFHMDFIELAARVNEEMPYHVAQKALLLVNGQHRGTAARRILILGVTFKRDIEDSRDSPAQKIIQLLESAGARVSYHDPYVPTLAVNGHRYHSTPLTEQTLRSADCVMIVTDHSSVDYAFVVRHARLVFDTRNATRHLPQGREKIVRV
ncbi:MAG TPA: nucleotide sugar dehydrogenase [bacterium]|jgi:UDP-N-acetyl-D-glucosamine dehydrogenase|nr:nucleotide sugar dehydrogenase [bacterium]